MSDGNRPHLGHLNLKAQGNYPKVLFVCTGGMLRSATSAHYMAAACGWNTRSAGTMHGALPTVDEYLLEWADQVYCMTQEHFEELVHRFKWAGPKIKVLDIEDKYYYRSPELVKVLAEKFKDEIAAYEKANPL